MNGLGYDQLVRGHNLSWYDLVAGETRGGGGHQRGGDGGGASQCCHIGCWRNCWEVFQTGVNAGYVDAVVAIQYVTRELVLAC